MRVGTGVIVELSTWRVGRRCRRGHGTERIRATGATPRSIVPHESWWCGMPAGIPGPRAGTLVFTAEMPLERVADIGRTQYGRRQVAVARRER